MNSLPQRKYQQDRLVVAVAPFSNRSNTTQPRGSKQQQSITRNFSIPAKENFCQGGQINIKLA